MAETLLVLGLQWGDEGKGQIIDFLADGYAVVVRFQGGANAGHTVSVGGEKFVLHLIPSGILHPGKLCVIGNGVALDPEELLREVQNLEEKGVAVRDSLAVSDRAHLVMPYHKLLDAAKENDLGAGRIGTTGRGIGPCYADQAARWGLRVAELLQPDLFKERLSAVLSLKNRILTSVYGMEPLDIDVVYGQYCAYAEELRPLVRDTVSLLSDALKGGKKILLEGAQGAMLDINFGTYPYVTSSNVAAGGASVGTGIPPSRIDRTLGVVKAYCSRVGEGSFPTEQDNETGERIRRVGNEFGSTTGRPRRTGWLDSVALRHAGAVNGVDSVAMTALSVLSEFKRMKICVAYKLDGQTISHFPSDGRTLDRVQPVYEELEGWQTDISGVRSWDELPRQTRDYLDAVEQAGKVRIEMITVGRDRGQIVRRTPDE